MFISENITDTDWLSGCDESKLMNVPNCPGGLNCRRKLNVRSGEREPRQEGSLANLITQGQVRLYSGGKEAGQETRTESSQWAEKQGLEEIMGGV